MFDPEIVKGFLQLGGMGILGAIFYFASKASDKRLDIMLASMSTERELWRLTINTLSNNIHENTTEVSNVPCLALPKRRR